MGDHEADDAGRRLLQGGARLLLVLHLWDVQEGGGKNPAQALRGHMGLAAVGVEKVQQNAQYLQLTVLHLRHRQGQAVAGRREGSKGP